jgi:C4-dicarboxylate transporter, DctM subunit
MGLDFFGMTHSDKSIWFGIFALMLVDIGLVLKGDRVSLDFTQKHSAR